MLVSSDYRQKLKLICVEILHKLIFVKYDYQKCSMEHVLP